MYISDSTTRKYALSSTGFATTAANPSLKSLILQYLLNDLVDSQNICRVSILGILRGKGLVAE